MEIIFVRHTSVDVPKGTCYGQTDVPVAATFSEEAEATRRQLSHYVPFDATFTSPLTRARLLAAYCGYPDATAEPRVMEMNMGEWEMQRYDEIQDVRLDAWYQDYMHLPTPGGESFPMLYQRVADFLDETRRRPWHRVAVFAHGGVLVAAGLYGGLFTAEGAWEHLVPFGGLQKITI